MCSRHSRELKTDFQILKFAFDVNDVNYSTKFQLRKRLSLIEPFSALSKTWGVTGRGSTALISLSAASQPSSRDDVFTTFAGGKRRVSSAALRSFFVTSARRVFLFGTIAATAGGYFRNNDRTHTRQRQTRARREDRQRAALPAAL